MGTRFAPSFANLYKGNIETEFITTDQPWHSKIITYKRYIDDLIFICDGLVSEFKEFTKYYNDNNWGLKFSADICPISLNYLDITLSHQEGIIITKNDFKSVDCNRF